MAPKLNVKIESLNYADISRDSFAIDPHTIVKQLGRDGYDMHGTARRGYLGNLERKNMVFVKAVDADAGSVVGYSCWVFTNPQEQASKTEASNKVTQEPDFNREPDAIERLHAL